MKLLFITLFIALPYISFSQEFTVKVQKGNVPESVILKIGAARSPTDKVPEHVTLPDKVRKFSIKKDKADAAPTTYTVQVGEAERSFSGDGKEHEIEFPNDIRGLVVTILDEKRMPQWKPFILQKAK